MLLSRHSGSSSNGVVSCLVTWPSDNVSLICFFWVVCNLSKWDIRLHWIERRQTFRKCVVSNINTHKKMWQNHGCDWFIYQTLFWLCHTLLNCSLASQNSTALCSFKEGKRFEVPLFTQITADLNSSQGVLCVRSGTHTTGGFKLTLIPLPMTARKRTSSPFDAV